MTQSRATKHSSTHTHKKKKKLAASKGYGHVLVFNK